MALIAWFNDLSKDDTATVGGKSANLGELAQLGVPVLPGFATTTEAYDLFIEEAGIQDELEELLAQVDTGDMANLRETGEKIRALIVDADVPDTLAEQVKKAYRALGEELGMENPSVAVRSSATAEDTAEASFAGQQDTYLDVTGVEDLLEAVKKCYASLFTDRAISYREDQGFNHLDVKLSCAVQKMGRSDTGSAGVMFTIDPDSGFEHVVAIDAAYGLGETVVQGQVNPDHYLVFKETDAIIEKQLGAKKQKLITDAGGHELVETSEEEQNQYCLTDQQIKELAVYAQRIEEHYEMPMDIEWLLDGKTEKLYIVQARPETVHTTAEANTIHNYRLEEDGELLVTGAAIGSKIGQGTVKVLDSPEEIDRFEDGDVLVTDMTDPDWEPIMKVASAIVTNRGGRTCFTGDTKILTKKGFMTMSEAHNRFQEGEKLQILAYDYGRREPSWKTVKESSVTERPAMRISCSQTGRATKNTIGVTPDHRMYTFNGRDLIKKEIQDVLADDEHVTLVDQLPGGKKESAVAYLAGAILTDGYTYSNKRRGGVILTQKETPEKEQFISRIKQEFEDIFGYRLSAKQKKSSNRLRGRLIEGVSTDFRCFKRDIAEIFIDIEERLDEWVLELDRESAREFLVGMLDGDGSINDNRLHIYIEKDHILRGAVLACLKLGIVPQVTTNREIWNLQIVEKQEELIKAAERIQGDSWEKVLSPKLFSAEQLLGDVVEDVNHKGKVKPYVQKNLLIGEDKLRKRVLPLAGEPLQQNLEEVLNSSLRMYRVSKEEGLGNQKVYNFEVDEEVEMEKNYVVFTSRYTPLLVSNSHAAIVSRELGIPAVVGAETATEELETGQTVTVDCSTGDGNVFDGLLTFTDETHDLEDIPDTETDVYVNIGEPGQVFHHAQLPVDGVGLAREEFIISSYVGEHPLSLIERGAEQKFVDALKYGIGKIAAAFYPKPVIVRLSDFKSDEYADLKGGEKFEPEEDNPMLGWRGASRYYDPNYRDAFHLELEALKQVMHGMGLDNVIPMVPFCRTVEEGRKVKEIIRENGLPDTEIYVMAEVPSNIWLADQFADVFDGFSIGSNDLTQLTLGIDRNSEKLSDLFDERNEAVTRSIAHLIEVAHEHGNKVGICGDAPSTYPEFAEFLVSEGIDSMSVTPDVALKTVLLVAEAENPG